VAKYSAEGTLQWVRQGGNYESSWTVSTANGNAVSTDKSGNVYVVATVLGLYDGWTDDQSLPVEKRYLGKAYYEDQVIEADDFYTGHQCMLLKISPEGDLIWKKVMAMGLVFLDVAIDADENAYLTDSMSGSNVFEGNMFEANGHSDILVMKIDKDGSTQWLKQFGRGEPASSGAYTTTPANDFESGQLIEVDPAGNVVISGLHFDKARFDDKVLDSDAFVKGHEFGNIFIAKLNNEGAVQWVKNARGKGSASFSGMECDSEGNTFICGRVLGKATLDGKKAKWTFVARFDPEGNIVWIDDSETRKKTLKGTEHIDISWLGGLALSSTDDYLYTTANVTKTTVESDDIIGTYLVLTTTTVETMVAVTKVETHK